jgi:hypothetical protein
MTIRNLTARKIVETYAHIDGLSAEDEKTIGLRFQYLDSKDHFSREYDPNATRTSAKLYSKREFARAAVLIDALLSGLEGEVLTSLAAALKNSPRNDLGDAPSADVGGAYVYGTGLDSAIRGTLANDPGRWLLYFAAGSEDGRIVHTSCVIYVPEGEHLESELAQVRRPIFTGTIDLTARFKPFGWLLADALD